MPERSPATPAPALQLASPHSSSRLWALFEILAPAIAALLIGYQYLHGDRWTADAPYYQAIALKAAREGHWWTLMQGSLPYFNKPPLDFWIHAAFVRIFGEHDWVARAPELIFYALTCLLVGLIARTLVSISTAASHPATASLAGLGAGLAMAGTYEWIFRIANFRLDFLQTLLLMAFVLAAAQFVHCAHRQVQLNAPTAHPSRSRTLSAILAGTCLGLALLTKPLMALLAPPMLLLWLLLIRPPSNNFRRAALRWILNSTLFAIILAASWHIAMTIQHGRLFLNTYFFVQQWQRATGELFSPEPWSWYLTYFFTRQDGTPRIALWPILALASLGALTAVVRSKHTNPKSVRPLALLGACWFLLWILLLSLFADKRHYYLLITYPGLALLCGVAVSTIARIPALARSPTRCRIVPQALAVSACAAGVLMATLRTRPPEVEAALSLAAADRRQLAEFLSANHTRDILYGGLRYNDASLLYIECGVWPRSLVEKEPIPRAQMPAGSLAVYDISPAIRAAQDRPSPAPADRVVFSAGRYVVTEIGAAHTP